MVVSTRPGNTPAGQAGFCSSILPEISEPRFLQRDEELVEAFLGDQGFSIHPKGTVIESRQQRSGPVYPLSMNGMVERDWTIHENASAGRCRAGTVFINGAPAGVDGPGRRTTERILFQSSGIATLMLPL